MSNAIVLRVFRALLRQAHKCDGMELRRPLTDAQWGSHRFVLSGPAHQSDVLTELFPSAAALLGNDEAPSGSGGGSGSGNGGGARAAEQPEPGPGAGPPGASAGPSAAGAPPPPPRATLPLARLVSRGFRMDRAAPPDLQHDLLNNAFKALRLLLEQRYMARCSSSRVTDGVRVDVTSSFESMSPGLRDDKVYVFSYRVCITNLRKVPVRVLGRSWTIKNDQGQVLVHVPLEPNNAIVGQQPTLPPGHAFEYFSGTDLNTPAGLQHGALLVDVLGDGRTQPPTERMVAEIAPFALLHPAALAGN